VVAACPTYTYWDVFFRGHSFPLPLDREDAPYSHIESIRTQHLDVTTFFCCWLGSIKEDICRAWVGSKVRWDGYPRMSVRGRRQLFILVKAFGVEGTFTTCLDRRLSLSVSVSIYFSFFPLLACVSDPVKTESLPCSMKDDLHYPAL